MSLECAVNRYVNVVAFGVSLLGAFHSVAAQEAVVATLPCATFNGPVKEAVPQQRVIGQLTGCVRTNASACAYSVGNLTV